MKWVTDKLKVNFKYIPNSDEDDCTLSVTVNEGSTHVITSIPDMTLNQILEEVKDVIVEELQEVE